MAVTSGSGNGEDRRARLVKALLFQPDHAACQACLDRLDEYVAAQLAGVDYRARFPEVALHLDACLDCAGAYARLYELELAIAEDRLPQPGRWPSPDLSFLHSGAGLMERLREAIRRVGDRLTLQLSADLLPL
ncbi:MAG: hypothetical protein L0177_19655, partial [Chloroflexi bacterium]|nr:hypothetical protein [Chloroflexota bacterium]